MAGFYINGKPLSQKKKKGFTVTHNDQTANTVEYDGKNFGTVTDMGLKAIKTNTLDSYTPETEEEKATIESFKSYLNEKAKAEERERQKKKVLNPVLDAVTETSFGNVKTDTAPKLTETLAKNFVTKSPEEEFYESATLEELKGLVDGAKNQEDKNHYVALYNNKFHENNIIKMAETKMDGENHSVWEELVAVSEMEKGEKKDKRKKALLETMDKIGIGSENYSVYTDDDNFSWGTFGKYIGNKAMQGVEIFNQGLASTANVLIGKPLQALGWKNNPVSKFSDYTNAKLSAWAYDAEQQRKKLGDNVAYKIAGELTSGTISAVPQAIMALMTAGTSLAGQGAQTSATLATQASQATGNILTKAGLTVQAMAKNPSFWSSFAQSYGNDYEQALEMGADATTAALGATITSLINAGIEIGGGLEKLPEEVKKGGKKALQWAISSVEEGGEEVAQKFVSNSIAKLLYDKNVELFNLKEYATDFAMGTAIGGILGGGQIGLQSTVDGINNALTKKAKGVAPAKDGVTTSAPTSTPVATEENAPVSQTANQPSETAETPNAPENTNVPETASEDNNVPETETAQTVPTKKEVNTTLVNVGDTFTDTKNGDTIKVISRDESNTTVEFTDKDGNVATAVFDNKSADVMNTNPRYVKAETVSEQTAEVESAKEAKPERIEAETEEAKPTVEATQSPSGLKVGDTFVDTKSGSTLKVVGRDNNVTTIEKTTADGKVIAQTFSNKSADNILNNPQYTPWTEQVAEETKNTKAKSKATKISNIIESKEIQAEEEPTQTAQNTSDSNETEVPKEIPSETQKATAERNKSNTESAKKASNKAKNTGEKTSKKTDVFDVIAETKNHEGKYWSPEKIEQFYKDNPDLDFIERIYQGDKNAIKELKEMLASIDDADMLDDLSWYVGETFKDKGYTSKTNYDTYKIERNYPYRGAIRKFRNAIRARINEIMTEKNNGTNLGIENGKVSLDDVRSLFTKLNSNDDLTELADRVFKLCEQLHLDISFVNKMLVSANGLAVGDIVQYKTSFFNDTAVTDQEKARTILHELIHSCTAYALTTAKDPNAKKKFASNPEVYQRLMDTAKQLESIYNEINNDPDFKGLYGIKDVYEMVAELSNPEFVEKLQNKTLWDKIVDAICTLFGIAKKSDAYSNVKACVDFLFNNFDKGLYDQHAKAQRQALRESGKGDGHYSFSSIANTFFGDSNMTTKDFESKDYKKSEGYKNYVNKCVDVFMQTHKGATEESARKEIEKSIEGIVDVAIASKKAGYDIFDDNTKRNVKDSKKRLLFSSLEPNSDYFTSSDISTICDKRQNFADIYDAIVKKEEELGVPNDKRFFNNVDNYFYIHSLMAEMGLTTPCRQCYVESMRKNLAPMAKNFLKLIRETDIENKSNDQLYQQSGKNKGTLKSNNAELREAVLEKLAEYGMSPTDLTIATLSTADGLAELKVTAPLIYEAFNSFYGQSKPKMPKSATPFRFGELTALLTDEKEKIKQSLVDKINSTGGFRLQSYSDFQIQNYVDVLQTIFEAGTLGLNGHAYTKVPAFLTATEGTNLKRNISIFMYKDGTEWKIDEGDSYPATLDELYGIVANDKSGNTGIIAVSQNEDMSAWIMANDNVGYGIPFHKSGMKMDTVRETKVKTPDGRTILGYAGIKDHTRQQTEVWAKTTADHKANTKVKNGIDIYSFWDFDNKDGLSKNDLIKKNLMAYIDACEKAGYLPKFREYVMNNGKVLNAVLKYSKELGSVPQNATVDDISFKYKGYTIPYGYHKFLGDFGMFTPDGKASPISPLSLAHYDFKKAVEFFSNSEELHRNEILQQFANDGERQKMRESGLSTEELSATVQERRDKVADRVVNRSNKKFTMTEDGGTNEGNDLLSGNERRRGNESAQKQVEGLSENTRRHISGEILSKGQTEEKVVDDVKLTLVKEEAYNNDMKSVVERNNQKGLNTHFFLGNGAYKFDSKKRILVDGMIDGNDVYLRYDGKFSPQTLNLHEDVHDNWNTEKTQKVKDEILNSLSEADKAEILSRDRYKNYAELYNGDMDKVWEEFVADVLAGMSTYSSQFKELTNNYWNSNDANLDNFKVSEYTRSTDAGGTRNEASKERPTMFATNKEWHTGFPLKVVEELERRVERDVISSTKSITDTANWYTTFINGKEYFVIYSTEEVKPTILYASRDKRAEFERDYLQNWIEVREYAQSNDGKPDLISRVSNSNWMPRERSIQNNVQRMGGGSDNRNVGVLQGQSRRKPSRAFRDVIENLFEVSGRRRGYSLNSTNYANTFYSHMAKVVDGIKQEKLGADSVVNMLRGKGVKAEEIKWSGIESWLEGKKSVTKAELQEFVAGSMLQIEEQVNGGGLSITLERSPYGDDSWYVMRGGEVFDEVEWNENTQLYESNFTGLGFLTKDKIIEYHKKNVESGNTRWSDYTLKGGSNYREVTFKMPDSSYTNTAMQAHWGGNAKGILAHARVQDFDIDGKKMLFIEEIQSDWHNEGHKKGYVPKRTPSQQKAFNEKLNNLTEQQQQAFQNLQAKLRSMSMEESLASEEVRTLREEERRLANERAKLLNEEFSIPDAPFKDNYHEFVLKRLIRMAVEDGYDSIGWTPSEIQSERWSGEYAEGYRIEYDQDIPKFLNKYGKKWGAKVGKESLQGTEVWSMDITDSMKDSVLYEGQPMYSLSAENLSGDIFSPNGIENRINELRSAIEETQDELDLGLDLTSAEEKSLNNKLFKLQHDLDKLIALEKKATVKTPIPTIIDNLSNYRLSDLHSLAEQISEGNWDGYEELSRDELESALEEELTARLEDLGMEDQNDKKFGFYVRPAHGVRSSYSLSTEADTDLDVHASDSEGKTLTKEQVAYFKDSKVRDEDGNLRAMYHGTPTGGFTEFKLPHYLSPLTSAQGAGYYFTDKRNAKQYTKALNGKSLTKKQLYEVYLNITNPLEISEYSEGAISDDAFRRIMARGNYKWGMEHTDVEQRLQVSRFDSERLAEMVRAFNGEEILNVMKEELGHDGVHFTDHYGDIWVAWDANQIKSVDNTTPTQSLDIHLMSDPETKENAQAKWDEALERYGAIQKGETPARDIDVPLKRAKDEPVSQFARTALEAGITPVEVVDDFQREIMFGKMAHEVITDKKAEEDALAKIKNLGFAGAVNNWNELFRDEKIGKKDFVFGMVLYNQAVTNKDYKLAMKLISDLTIASSQSAQVLQSVRMLKKMSPDGTLYYLEKSVEKMNEEFKEQLGEKFENIEIDSELMKELYEAETTEARDEALEKIEQNIADQIPTTLTDKWNAWRYLAMLGNVRTHGRNIFGNLSFWGARKVKNLLGAVMEKAIPVEKRTKSLKKTKESVDFAKEDSETMKDILTGTGGKFATGNKIQQKRTIFKTEWLELIRRKNFDFLGVEDWWFLKDAYQDSLAQLITARKIDVNSLKAGTSEANDLLNKIRAYAIKEAKVATFNQISELGNVINRAKRELAKGGKSKKAVGVLLEGVMPFTNVPINIAKQGVAYSPIGLGIGIKETLSDVKKGKKTASEAIDTLSKGLTGTAITALGVVLSAMGLIVAEPDEDDKKKEYDKMRGHQSYALEIGDSSYTIDWLTPSSLPLFVGVELCNLFKQEGASGWDIVNALSRIVDPMVELSVLQGVSDALSTAKYTEENPFVTVPVGMLTSYLGQALPTLGGQITRLVDDKQRTVYIEKGEGFLTGQFKRFIQTTAKKIPFVSMLLEPQIDAWGNEKTYGSFAERLAESTVSPGYYSKITSTEVDEELQKIFEATGDNGVYPALNTVKSLTEKKKTHNLNAQQSREYAEERGKRALKKVTNLINNKRYASMSDKEKLKWIKHAYDKAHEEAKALIIKKYFKE